MKAVDKFDGAVVTIFSTYATVVDPSAIPGSIADQARTMRIPVHMISIRLNH